MNLKEYSFLDTLCIFNIDILKVIFSILIIYDKKQIYK